MVTSALRLISFVLMASASCTSFHAEDSAWIFPHTASDPLTWGRKDGIVFGLPSAGGMRGPRGLIRVGTIDPQSGEPQLLNFIAVEPVVEGKKPRGNSMAFSELEKSALDRGERGARLWVVADASGEKAIHREHSGEKEIEALSVRVEIERFPANGAHVYLLLSITSDHPNELRLSAYPYADSKPLDEMVFTATMGAYERLRFLWLKDRVVDSRKLYADYTGEQFAEHDALPSDDMLHDADGNPIALCTSSEQNPAAARNPLAQPDWYYDGSRLTQYWKIPAKDVVSNLRVRVNGRYVYWASKNQIPGGATFENFELRERFTVGQTFIFGITGSEPSAWKPALAHLAVSPPLD